MIKKLFAFLCIVVILFLMIIFNYNIQKQNKLDMEELEQIVEKEIVENHGK